MSVEDTNGPVVRAILELDLIRIIIKVKNEIIGNLSLIDCSKLTPNVSDENSLHCSGIWKKLVTTCQEFQNWNWKDGIVGTIASAARNGQTICFFLKSSETKSVSVTLGSFEVQLM